MVIRKKRENNRELSEDKILYGWNYQIDKPVALFYICAVDTKDKDEEVLSLLFSCLFVYWRMNSCCGEKIGEARDEIECNLYEYKLLHLDLQTRAISSFSFSFLLSPFYFFLDSTSFYFYFLVVEAALLLSSGSVCPCKGWLAAFLCCSNWVFSFSFIKWVDKGNILRLLRRNCSAASLESNTSVNAV